MLRISGSVLDGPDQFRCFILPSNLDQDVYVGGVEFRPDNRRIVHHALIFVDSNGAARRRARNSDGSYSCFGGPGIPGVGLIGGWVPGASPLLPSDEYSRPVPRGADIVVQIHYHPSGKPELDQSSLGLTFAGPPKKGRTAALVLGPRIDIPPGDAHYVVKGQITLPRDVEVTGISPHAHYLCKQMKVTAYLPDGSAVPLIWIKDWDFNWQGTYRYEKPIVLPKDTRIDLEYTYDNSENNPRNPAHPPVRVTWGEQTTDEMALAFLTITLPSPEDAQAFQRQIAIQYVEAFLYDGVNIENLPSELPAGQRERIAQVFRLVDRNSNGILDPDEGIGCAPDNECGLVQLGDGGAQVARRGAGVGRGAIELQDGAAGVAVVLVVHLVHERRRQPAGARFLHGAPPSPARDPGLDQLPHDGRAPAFGHRVPFVARQDA